jgi:uncharacterized membrane protein YidH (DUF202 family)
MAELPLAQRVHPVDAEELVVKLIGVLLIAFGVVALAVGGINYTKREKILDIGPLHASADTQQTLLVPPIVGILAVVGGVVLLATATKTGA